MIGFFKVNLDPYKIWVCMLCEVYKTGRVALVNSGIGDFFLEEGNNFPEKKCRECGEYMEEGILTIAQGVFVSTEEIDSK